MRHPDICVPTRQTGAHRPLNLKRTYRYRVAAAPVIAQRSCLLFLLEHVHCRVDDPLAVAVDCYAGSRGEETPRRFTLENQLVEIQAIVDQWRTPDHRYFRVRTTASETYTLRQDVKSGVWELTGVGVTPAEDN